MKKTLSLLPILIFTFLLLAPMTSEATLQHHETKTNWQERKSDWRVGPIVYQVFVDRFAPSENLKAKQELYPSPKKLHPWSDVPKKGTYVPEVKVWSHEIDYWGGDLQSLTSKLNYISGLGVDVLYLNPIFSAYTNHKYDTIDYLQIDPAYGSTEDLKNLVAALHAQNMKLVLDGVFNHMSVRSPMFQDAFTNPESKWRPFFKFTDKNTMGYIGWWNVANLPELNFDDKKVQDYIYAGRKSVVQHYLSDVGIDGWRLDVAYDLGPKILTDLTKHAHSAKKDALILGEIWNYPNSWNQAVDGLSNMNGRQIILDLLNAKLEPAQAANMWGSMVKDTGIDFILKSWLMLTNHDTPRMSHLLAKKWQQDLAVALQFTLPGSVYLYYGNELGMQGGEDPEQRAPMQWDLVNDKNTTLQYYKKLIALRKKLPALRYGDFTTMNAEKTFAFMRTTNSIGDTVVVVINPTNETVKEPLQLQDGRIHSNTSFHDQLSGRNFGTFCGMLHVELKAHEVLVLKIDTAATKDGYNPYEGIE